MADRELGGATLNTLPEGLLDLLGIKSFGQYPNRLLTQLQPSIDLTSQYIAAESKDYSFSVLFPGNSAAGAIGITATFPENLSNGAAIVVPTGEIWIVSEFGLSWTIPAGAGNAAGFVPMLSSQGNFGIALACFTGTFGTGVAAPSTGGWASLSRPVIIRPGSVLQYFTTGIVNAAGSVSLQGCVRLARLTV